MKYAVVLGFLIAFSGTNLAAQSTKDSLKPKMKMVKEVLYRVEHGELKNRADLFGSKLTTYIIYDKNEEIIEYVQYKTDGAVYEKTTYERNEKGDAQKGITKNASGEIISYWIYECDSKENLIEVKTYDAENNLTEIQSNKNDENGNIIEILLKSPESEKGWRYVYKYNSDNKKIEELSFKPDGSLKDRRMYSYDKHGNENTVIKFYPDGEFVKKVYEYDTMNNLIIENTFDKHGKLRRQTSFEYLYDDYGNWITNKRSADGELNMVYERQIEYHE
ncbi:hypothetical protein [Maribacter polysaccharolyticus]|uniref:hypothetical protein n=1 Tax=Maribacter polysaccharolyticus TaxID=3020831 RepID=UPI00237F1D3C|nr:hypothetical protein [Maribacter polysaccharolyticus]MDE3743274.1 hypothetical protein [Maribacter polysaccharolyticus]